MPLIQSLSNYAVVYYKLKFFSKPCCDIPEFILYNNNNNNNDNLLHARFLGNTDSVAWQNVQDTNIMKQSSEMREN